MTFSGYGIIALLVAFQSFLLGGFLLSEGFSGRPRGRQLLGIFTTMVGGHFLNIVLLETNQTVVNIGGCFAVFYAPLLYAYVRVIVDPSWQPHRGFWPHALPLLLCIYWAVDDFQNKIAGQPVNNWLTAPILLQMMIYLFFTWRHFLRYGEIVVQSRSSIGFARKRMLQFFLILYAMLMIGVSMESLFTWLQYPSFQIITTYAVFSVMLILICGLSVMGLGNPNLFNTFEPNEVTAASDKQEKYKTSSLSEDDANLYVARLEQHMLEEAPYLNPALKLGDLARSLKIPPRYLSQVINQQLGLTFFDYINRHRIERVKASITEDSDARQTLLTHMLEAGFQSKSSFNKAFLKHVGTTPSKFRSTLNNP